MVHARGYLQFVAHPVSVLRPLYIWDDSGAGALRPCTIKTDQYRPDGTTKDRHSHSDTTPSMVSADWYAPRMTAKQPSGVYATRLPPCCAACAPPHPAASTVSELSAPRCHLSDILFTSEQPCRFRISLSYCSRSPHGPQSQKQPQPMPSPPS
jgi:hypothetical protein